MRARPCHTPSFAGHHFDELRIHLSCFGICTEHTDILFVEVGELKHLYSVRFYTQISFHRTGHTACLTALVLALAVNFVLMLFSLPLGRLLRYLHLVGPLIRITGLIVSAVAVQMILSGASEWLKSTGCF